ncbi:MAG: hypothetical protein KatS3mg101_1004 [Patescibacteria group bacterium]|nr:MAG: hypothetical protein KatS3mg101_1004 [Patescibacteria group bacterium]
MKKIKVVNTQREDIVFHIDLLDHLAKRVEEFFELDPREARGYLSDLRASLKRWKNKIGSK